MMMSHAVPMSLSSEYPHYPFSSSSMGPLPWVPPSHGPFKLFTPTYSAAKLCVECAPSSVPQRKKSRKGLKASYKHVPHKDKPPHLVARRNARERRRVQAVNSAFARLRKCVPIENRSKRLSKVKTLHRAIEYINGLQAMLDGDEPPAEYMSDSSPDEEDVKDEREELHDFDEYLESDVVNKENEDQAWTTLSTSCESNYWTYMPYNQDYAGHLTS